MMARGRRTGFVIMLLSTGLFVFLGLGLERSTPQGMLDFKSALQRRAMPHPPLRPIQCESSYSNSSKPMD